MLQRNIKVLGINKKYLSYYENHTLFLMFILDHSNNICLLKTAWFKKLKLHVFYFLHILEKMSASAPFNAFVFLVGWIIHFTKTFRLTYCASFPSVSPSVCPQTFNIFYLFSKTSGQDLTKLPAEHLCGKGF